jgi:protein-tyrosine phosphatase
VIAKNNPTPLMQRDLKADLDLLQGELSANTIVTLLDDYELRLLRVQSLKAEVEGRGMRWIQNPIVEMAAPRDPQDLAPLVETISREVAVEGRHVIAHCRGGMGRAGLLAACVLIELGMADGPVDAIAKVRAARDPAAVESRAQEAFIARYWAFRRNNI